MHKKTRCRNSSIIILAALLCAAALYVNSCDLPEGPDFGKGTLILFLPGTAAPAHSQAAVSRSVLLDTGGLKYRVVITGPGAPQTLPAVEGSGTSVSLDPGEWLIEAEAYDLSNPAVTVGTGSATVIIVAGKDIPQKIKMSVLPAYEALLTEIYIHNEAELRRIGAAENGLAIDNSRRTFYLEEDIVLTQPWTPIGGGSDTSFRAVFDGQGHSITVNSFDDDPVVEDSQIHLGFFAYVDGATIRDLTINYPPGGPVVDMSTGAGSTYTGGNAGGVAGRAEDASFENIQVTGNFSVIFDGTSNLYAGGIAGQANSVTITNCRVTGTIGGTSANYLTIGGIAGYISNPSYVGGDISGSSFTGTISGNSSTGNIDVGGIAGYMMNGEITGCHASGDIDGESPAVRIGGIAGIIQNISAGGGGISESSFTGTISGNSPTGNIDVGGIAGYMSNAEITGCHASGDIDGESPDVRIGGIAGYISNPSYVGGDISESSFTGTIRGNAPAGNDDEGGIAGHMSNAEISACFAEGSIKAEADSPRVGGIAGNIDASSGISKSYAAGVIESIAATGSYSTAGGIAGFSNGTIENCYAWADISSSSTLGENAGGIAGENGGTISKCYAAGTVQSKGPTPYTYVGGITGSDQSQTVSGCMALVSELDGGPSTSTSKNVYAIGSLYAGGTFSGNYSRNDIMYAHRPITAFDFESAGQGGQQKPLNDFKSQTLYTGASWTFTSASGTGGDWNFLDDYDYPVLSWQETAPPSPEEAARGDFGIDFEWP
jgi:hypothetical protein